jgi:outer membrane protein OmpA-like peptidoglycan-associated protein
VTTFRRWILVIALATGATLSAAAPSCATSPPLYLVLFPTDDVTLDVTQKAVLDQVITDFRLSARATVTVTGHYDRTGTQDHRVRMSRRYAEAVTEYLIAHGLPEGATTTSWRGDEELSVPTQDGIYELANRYVLVVIEVPRD